MVNRVMKQKRLKMVRMRRAWARSLSYKGGFNPNREVVKNYALHARGLEDTQFVDRLGEELNKRIEAEKIAAHKKQGELEGWLPKDCHIRFQGPGPSNLYQESWTYRNPQGNCFVVVLFDKKQGYELRSTNYSSKELLLYHWEADSITWVYKKRIE